MFGGPPLLGFPAVVIGPDDLVQKVLTPKNHVQRDLRVVHFVPVQMEIERPLRREYSPGFLKPWSQECPVISKAVVVTQQLLQSQVVQAATKSASCALAPGTG